MESKNKVVGISIPLELLQKIRLMAEQQSRTLNGQMLYLIKLGMEQK